MKDLVKKFISENEKARIVESVKKAEKTTTGEIVPMIVSSSGEYPLSCVIGALAVSIPLSMVGAYFAGPLFHMGMRDMWVFLGLETALFIVSYLLVKNVLWLRRIFTSRSEVEEEVRRSAIANFYLNGLYRTRDETGVLIFISIFERTVWVLGDRGINEKVGTEAWNELVSIITEGIRNRKQSDAICRAVERAGEILSAHFPIKPDDTDELPDLITGR
jgi:putative membrane protein